MNLIQSATLFDGCSWKSNFLVCSKYSLTLTPLFSPKVEFCGYRWNNLFFQVQRIKTGWLYREEVPLSSIIWPVIHHSSSPVNTSTDGITLTVFLKRIDGLSSLDALINALSELDKVCDAIEDKYLESLREDKFERWEEQRWCKKDCCMVAFFTLFEYLISSPSYGIAADSKGGLEWLWSQPRYLPCACRLTHGVSICWPQTVIGIDECLITPPEDYLQSLRNNLAECLTLTDKEIHENSRPHRTKGTWKRNQTAW